MSNNTTRFDDFISGYQTGFNSGNGATSCQGLGGSKIKNAPAERLFSKILLPNLVYTWAELEGERIPVPLTVPTGDTFCFTNFEIGDHGNFKEIYSLTSMHSSDGDPLGEMGSIASKLPISRQGREFSAASFFSALKYSDLHLGVDQNINILDVGNCGEAWLYPLVSSTLKSEGHKGSLDYYTLDVRSEEKEDVISVVPSKNRHEIIHDASDLKSIDQKLLPKDGFNIIHIARASCEIFENIKFISALEGLYDLLSPGGVIIFPAVGIHISDHDFLKDQKKAIYETEIGTFKIGGISTPVLSPSDFVTLSAFKHQNIDRKIMEFCLNWLVNNCADFYRNNFYKDGEGISYSNFYEYYYSSHPRFTIESLSFFENIIPRSCDITINSRAFDQSKRPKLSIRYTFSAKKPLA